MILVESAVAACYCGCYATRLQILNAAIVAGPPQGLILLATPAAFWQHLADEQPKWVVVTRQQFVREPELAALIRKAYPLIGIVLCVLPDSPAPALLWPILRQLEPDTFCTLAEFPACLTALAEKRPYHSGLVAVFSQLAAVLPDTFGYSQMTPHPEELRALTAREVRIMREMLHGLCRRKIAAALFISPCTVDNHKANIARKLGAAAAPYGLTKYVLEHKEVLTNWLESMAEK